MKNLVATSQDKQPLLCTFIDDEKRLEDSIAHRHFCYRCADNLCQTENRRQLKDARNIKFHWCYSLDRAKCLLFFVASASGISFCVSAEDNKNRYGLTALGVFVYNVVLKCSVPIVVALISVMVINYIAAKPSYEVLKQQWIEDAHDLESIRRKLCLEKGKEKQNVYAKILSQAIQLRTVSYDDFDAESRLGGNSKKIEYSQFTKMHKLLEESFPMIHKKHPPKIINEYSLLFYIPGSDQTLKPIMLCSHMDVVPAPNDERNSWVHDPFEGKITSDVALGDPLRTNWIWGRGSIDNKNNVIGQLAAVENILSNQSINLLRGLYIGKSHIVFNLLIGSYGLQ